MSAQELTGIITKQIRGIIQKHSNEKGHFEKTIENLGEEVLKHKEYIEKLSQESYNNAVVIEDFERKNLGLSQIIAGLENSKKELEENVRLKTLFLEDLAGSINFIEDYQSRLCEEYFNNILLLKNAYKEENEANNAIFQEILHYNETMIESKEKDAEYYKDVYIKLEQEYTENHLNSVEHINELEAELKDTKNKLRILEREAKRKKFD